MRVTVHYMAQVRRASGRSSEIVELSVGAALLDLLRSLADHHGGAMRTMLLDDAAAPRKSLLYFVGDDHAEPSRLLRDGDSVTLLAPMSGG